MSPPKERTTPRFCWLDGLILVLALSCGTIAGCVDLKRVESVLRLPDSMAVAEANALKAASAPGYKPGPSPGILERSRVTCQDFLMLFLPCATLGGAIATFRHRECRTRRQRRRPGVLMTAVASILVLLLPGNELIFRWLYPYGFGAAHLQLSFEFWYLEAKIGLAMAGLWGVLAMARPGTQVRGWPDGLGRAIAAGWILWMILATVLRLAFMPI